MICKETHHYVFYKHSSSGQCIYLIVYVDDIVITGDYHDDIKYASSNIYSNTFKPRNLGQLCYFLGIEVAQSRIGIVVSWRKYVANILEETKMLNCKPIDNPMDSNVKLMPSQRSPIHT